MKKKLEAEKENGERWMLTYLDMITLLFAFFVVLYALSNIDKTKYEAVAESLSSAFATNVTNASTGVGRGQGKVITTLTQKIPKAPIQSKVAHSRAYDRAYDIIKSHNMLDKLKIRQEERGIVIQLGAEMFFAPASADVKAENNDVLITVAEIINGMPNKVQIEGSTDSVPPDPTSAYKSNWELAAERAINVLQRIESFGIPPRECRPFPTGIPVPSPRTIPPRGGPTTAGSIS